MRLLLLTLPLALCSLPALGQTFEELEGEHFVIRWESTAPVTNFDAARVLGSLEVAYGHGVQRGFAVPALSGGRAVVRVDEAQEALALTDPNFEIVVGLGVFGEDEDGRDFALARAWLQMLARSADVRGGCSLMDAPDAWMEGAASLFARGAHPDNLGSREIYQRHREDMGLEGAANAFLYLLWREEVQEIPTLVGGIDDCQLATTFSGTLFDGAVEEAVNPFLADIIDYARFPDDLAASEAEFASIFIFEEGFALLPPLGLQILELEDDGPVFISVNTPGLVQVSVIASDTAGFVASTLFFDEVAPAERRLVAMWNLDGRGEVEASFFVEGEFDDFDDCFECFERGPVCSGSEFPKSAPWGFAACLLLAGAGRRSSKRC